MVKKVLYQSDSATAYTGFGRATKAILSYLYETKKYELVNYACGFNWSNSLLQKTPWKTIGVLPDNPQELQFIKQQNRAFQKLAGYGNYCLDRVIQQEKPDIYIACQDIWGIDFAMKRPWFNKITSVLWTTLDSLPILPSAVEAAKNSRHFWVWSDFAARKLREMGYPHVKTVHGPIDHNHFYPLNNSRKKQIRKEQNLSESVFIIGFVFRNQLRKTVPNLIKGYALWKKSRNVKNSRLLLHTNFSEQAGWRIHDLCEQHGVDKYEVLATYVCKNCRKFDIKPFVGEDQNCQFCSTQKSQITANTHLGVSEEKLNEIYNLMDVYCHPFTSGGQEIPILEAKLAGLITLVTNYSCGEDLNNKDACSLPLEYAEYPEHGTQFIKASTYPGSIAKQIQKVYQMPNEKRRESGLGARKWILENYSIDKIGKIVEDFIDNQPKTDYDFSMKPEDKNPNAVVPEFMDTTKWLKANYRYILGLSVEENDEGLQNWLKQISINPK